MFITQSCPTLCDPVDCSPLGSFVHGILQERILEWVAILFSRGSSQERTSVQFSHSVVSDSLRSHGLQHTRLPCPLPTPGAYSNSCPSNHLIFCHPLLLPPSIFPSIRVFSSESVLRIRWPKYWSFSFSINPSNDYSGLDFL